MFQTEYIQNIYFKRMVSTTNNWNALTQTLEFGWKVLVVTCRKWIVSNNQFHIRVYSNHNSKKVLFVALIVTNISFYWLKLRIAKFIFWETLCVGFINNCLFSLFMETIKPSVGMKCMEMTLFKYAMWEKFLFEFRYYRHINIFCLF